MRVGGPIGTLLVLAALASGCSDDQAPPPRAPASSPPADAAATPPEEPASPSPEPISQGELARLDKLMSKVQFAKRLGPDWELRHVIYSSREDAQAEFVHTGLGAKDLGTAIAVTDDNWAHAATLVVPPSIAGDFSTLPLDNRDIVVTAGDPYSGRPIPPFILHADRTVTPLLMTAGKTPEGDSRLLGADRYGLLWAVGRSSTRRLWALDVDDAELFPVKDSRFGDLWQRVPGRSNSMISVQGYKRRTQMWTFDTSTDEGRTWMASEVPLPLKGTFPSMYAGVTHDAVGPGRRHAVAVSSYFPDLPARLHDVWQTDDELTFERVRLPLGLDYFGGIAYASDGALLLAEVQGSTDHCGSEGRTDNCNRSGRIWRLPPDGGEFELLRDAPTLFGHFAMVGISVSGGMIVARTGLDSVAVSRNGYEWTEVRPGR